MARTGPVAPPEGGGPEAGAPDAGGPDAGGPDGAAPEGMAPLGAAPDGAGGGALACLSFSQVSKSGPASAWTSNSMIRWPEPHSSAHWPRNVWPASLSLTLNSNTFVRPGTTSRLNRNCGT